MVSQFNINEFFFVIMETFDNDVLLKRWASRITADQFNTGENAI